MSWSIEMAVWTCFLGYVFSLATAALTSKQFYRSGFSSTGDSGYYSPKLQHLNMFVTKCSRSPMIAVTPLHIISFSRSWIILKCWHILFFCNLKYKGLKKTINTGEHPGQKINLCLVFREKRKVCHNAQGRYNKELFIYLFKQEQH